MKKLLLTLIFLSAYFNVWAQCGDTTTTSMPVEAAIVTILPSAEPVADLVDDGTNTYVISGSYTNFLSNNVSPMNTVKGTFLPKKMAIGGNVAVVTGSYRNVTTGVLYCHLLTVNISNIASPVIYGELATTYTVSANTTMYDVAVNSTGTMAVVAFGTNGLWVIDLRTPASPTRIYTYDTTGTSTGVALNSTATKAYVADGLPGIIELNVSLSAAPTLVSTSKLTGKVFKDVALNATRLVAVDQNGAFCVWNVATTPPGYLATKPIAGLGAYIAINGSNRVATICQTSTVPTGDYLQLFDITTPTAITQIGSTLALPTPSGSAKGLQFSLGKIYIPDSNNGIIVYTIP